MRRKPKPWAAVIFAPGTYAKGLQPVQTFRRRNSAVRWINEMNFHAHRLGHDHRYALSVRRPDGSYA